MQYLAIKKAIPQLGLFSGHLKTGIFRVCVMPTVFSCKFLLDELSVDTIESDGQFVKPVHSQSCYVRDFYLRIHVVKKLIVAVQMHDQGYLRWSC